MVVQTIQNQTVGSNFVQIPPNVPNEILENDSLLVLEKGLNQLEDRVILTARIVLAMNYELKTQIKEINRAEDAIISIHELMLQQHNRIDYLEKQVKDLKSTKTSKDTNHDPKPSLWARLFSNNKVKTIFAIRKV